MSTGPAKVERRRVAHDRAQCVDPRTGITRQPRGRASCELPRHTPPGVNDLRGLLPEEHMDALHAPALPPGGTIGIASPASPYTAYSAVRLAVPGWHGTGYH